MSAAYRSNGAWSPSPASEGGAHDGGGLYTNPVYVGMGREESSTDAEPPWTAASLGNDPAGDPSSSAEEDTTAARRRQLAHGK